VRNLVVVRRAKRRTQEERSAETRRKLIDAAIQLIHESGFARLTIADVAHRAKMTTGAMQHHFPSSQDLIRGVVETIYPVMRISIDEIATAELSLAERVDRLIDVFWKIYRQPEYLVFWDLTFGTRDQPEIREALRSFQKDIVAGMIAELVRVFADIGMEPKAAAKLWAFIGCQLRGLALLSMFEDTPALNADLLLLKEATRHLFVTLSGRAKRG
jgi:AcrR family transcriptional regulator